MKKFIASLLAAAFVTASPLAFAADKKADKPAEKKVEKKAEKKK